MSTIDLSTPPPAPVDLLDGLPRRLALTLPELQLVARAAGGAPLPFELQAPAPTNPMENRLGATRATTEEDAYAEALAALHDPEESLSRRGLVSADGRVDAGLTGAVGLLATPTVALDLDVAAGGVRAKSWHRQARGAVAALATVDGIVFELAWFPSAKWPDELGRVATIPEDIAVSESSVPDLLDVPFELADTVGEALRSGRADLVPVLMGHHRGKGTAGAEPLSDGEVQAALTALHNEGHGRLRGLATDLSSGSATVVGVVSWMLVADGWRALRPHHDSGVDRVEVRRVAPADLAATLAPVLAEVTP